MLKKFELTKKLGKRYAKGQSVLIRCNQKGVPVDMGVRRLMRSNEKAFKEVVDKPKSSTKKTKKPSSKKSTETK